MFGLSFGKLLVLAAVIAGVFFFFRMVTKLERSRRDLARGERGGAVRGEQGGGLGAMFRRKPAPSRAEPETQEMHACPSCGTYVPARGARDCGRELCPYGV
ncbi:hypothetical protein [Oceanibaculum pacificum]|uniref:Uncharacterized protein n=1 Tax=Oceanibaculum pacificum TaxID=580166 RepID=A0A154W837_9PROT|nr:hypothetical protein [Oceanibaculum pacificum]KZD09690.1 hypothetical protein AUP43_07010 [Oceanibaculum pacificum]